MSKYFVNLNNEVHGPMSVSDIASLIRKKKLMLDGQVKLQGSKSWVDALSVPQIMDAISSVEVLEEFSEEKPKKVKKKKKQSDPLSEFLPDLNFIRTYFMEGKSIQYVFGVMLIVSGIILTIGLGRAAYSSIGFAYNSSFISFYILCLCLLYSMYLTIAICVSESIRMFSSIDTEFPVYGIIVRFIDIFAALGLVFGLMISLVASIFVFEMDFILRKPQAVNGAFGFPEQQDFQWYTPLLVPVVGVLASFSWYICVKWFKEVNFCILSIAENTSQIRKNG